MNTQTQLTISDLQELLNKIKIEYGDLPIVLHDADTDWIFPIKPINIEVSDVGDSKVRSLKIRVGYHEEHI